MKIVSKPMGEYQTNCYIVTINDKSLIIDPGIGAAEWVKENAKNPIAILNTHGHFDHVWSDAQLKEDLNLPVIIHEKDAFFLKKNQFGMAIPPCEPDILIKDEKTITIEEIEFRFLHFPGHTPGCCVIEFEEAWFSGDFIFRGSIGRVDFPYSDPEEMKRSLKKFSAVNYDKPVYPGHGPATTVKEEQRYVDYWLNAI